MSKKKHIGQSTKSIWGGEQEHELYERSTQVPVVHSVSFAYKDIDTWHKVALGEVEGHIYSRNTNPTVRAFEDKVKEQFSNGIDRKIIMLPENTGHSQYNGHRIYGAMPYLTDADYVIFLDEDNWIDSNHIKDLVKVAEDKDWAFSFRKIVGQDNEFICEDDCESLGKWHTCLSEKEFFLDTGCYFLPKALAVQLSPSWYRSARHPEEQPEVDRLLMHMLLQNNYTYDTTYEYSLNYRVGNRDDSVKADFFLNGNKWMIDK